MGDMEVLQTVAVFMAGVIIGLMANGILTELVAQLWGMKNATDRN